MAAHGLSGLISKKHGRTTIRLPGVRVAEDLDQRQFRPDAPDVLWFADITYLRSWEGWLLGVPADHQLTRRQRGGNGLGDVMELSVTVWVRGTLTRLLFAWRL